MHADINTCQKKAHHFIPVPETLILSSQCNKHCWINATYLNDRFQNRRQNFSQLQAILMHQDKVAGIEIPGS